MDIYELYTHALYMDFVFFNYIYEQFLEPRLVFFFFFKMVGATFWVRTYFIHTFHIYHFSHV